MKRVIWKFNADLQQGDEVHIEMPKGAEVLSLQVQHGSAVLWAMVNPDERIKKERRRFKWVPTGGEVPRGGRFFVGTVQLEGGALVFHLFEIGIRRG